MCEYRKQSKDREKTADQYSTSHSADYPLYLQNIKYNLQQNLPNYDIQILNKQNQHDFNDQDPIEMFSLIITSSRTYSHRYQLFTQVFLNQQTFSFYVKHNLTMNNRHLLFRNKLSINVALILSNKINKIIDNIQLIIDPVSGKIYFQTKSFINQTSLSHLKKSIPRHDCFYTQIVTYSIKMAQRYTDLVLFLIGQISLSDLLKNPVIKKKFQFLSESQKILQNLQKSMSCFGIFRKEIFFQNKNQISQREQSQDYKLNYMQKTLTENVLYQKKSFQKQNLVEKYKKSSENLFKSSLYKTLQFFTPNIQSSLKLYCSESPYSNIDVHHSFNLFQKIYSTGQADKNRFSNDRTVQQLGFQSSRRSQYAKKILTFIEVVGFDGRDEEQDEEWKILSQGGFGIVEIATVRFKNLSISYQHESSVIIRQQLVRKRDKINKKLKIKRQRRILQKLQNQVHPNIASFYLSYQLEYENAIFSDYTPHMSLDVYLKKNPLSISFTHKLLFIQQAVEGLIFLHSKKIVHLDIKPGNMLIHKSLRVQLSDFGEAFMIDQDDMETHQHAYTVPYCPPEIFYDPPILCEGADIYAIGVCLLKQVLDKNCFETFFRKKFTLRISKDQLDNYSIGQKFEKSFLSHIFKIIQHISLLAVSQKRQQRPKLKWIKQILEMCRNFIIELIY